MSYHKPTDEQVRHANKSRKRSSSKRSSGRGVNAPADERLVSIAWHRHHVFGVPAEEAVREVLPLPGSGGEPNDISGEPSGAQIAVARRLAEVLALVKDPTTFDAEAA
jgi:hypothetical protein